MDNQTRDQLILEAPVSKSPEIGQWVAPVVELDARDRAVVVDVGDVVGVLVPDPPGQRPTVIGITEYVDTLLRAETGM